MRDMEYDDDLRIAVVIKHLRKARDILKVLGAPKTLAKVRRAIRSAEGAERHIGRFPPRETLWGPERRDTNPRCPKCGALPTATLDMITGCEAHIDFDDKEQPFYLGDTEVNWNGQEPMLDEETHRPLLWCGTCCESYPAPSGFKVE